MNDSITGEVDGHLSCGNIVRPVVLVLVEKIKIKDLTNSIIHKLSLIIYLWVVG